MFYVYRITNLVNGKMYIGKTNNLKQRWRDHKSVSFCIRRKDEQYLIHKAIAKYGIDSFDFDTIKTLASEKDAFKTEIYYIAYYETNVRKYGKDAGYNMTDGGEGTSGYKHTKRARQKMSLAKKGLPSHKKGIPLSKEQKRKISITRLASGSALGSKNPKAKIGERDVIRIKRLLSQKRTNQEVANITNISVYIIADIRSGRSWKNVGKPLEKRFSLTETDVRTIRNLLKKGITRAILAREFNVSKTTIRYIAVGKTWSWLK